MSVARTYAKSLFEIAKETGNGSSDLKAEREQIAEFVQLLKTSKELQVAFLGPAISNKQKAEVLRSFGIKKGFSKVLIGFLALLARKGRLPLLGEIQKALDEVRLESEGGVFGEVVSAEEMSAKEVADLEKSFTKKMGHKVEFRVSLDPSLLAGLRVTVGGVTYDGTLKSQLSKLRENFIRGSLVQ